MAISKSKAVSSDTTEKIEEKIQNIVSRVRDLQMKVSKIQAQATQTAKQAEVSARESLHKAFDGGLSLLGKGIVNGRKATESFVAETHRKAKKLERETQAEEAVEAPVSEVIPAAAIKKSNKMNAKSVSAKNQMKTLKNKSRKNKSHFAATARSH